MGFIEDSIARVQARSNTSRTAAIWRVGGGLLALGIIWIVVGLVFWEDGQPFWGSRGRTGVTLHGIFILLGGGFAAIGGYTLAKLAGANGSTREP